MAPISSPSNTMRPEVWSEQPHHHHRRGGLAAAGLADQADALAMADGEADAVDGAELLRLDRRLAREQFSEHRGGALARIFLDELFDDEQRLRPRQAALRRSQRSANRQARLVGAAQVAAALLLRKQIAQRHAEPRRRAHQLLGVGVRGTRKDIGGRRGLDHVALLHHHDAVAIGGGKAEIMRDQDGRHAARAWSARRSGPSRPSAW